MRNVVGERPTRDLHGRLAFSRSFVDVSELAERDVLDVGCGFGWFVLFALDEKARSVTAVEPRESDLATARLHIGDDRVTFAVASMVELPFPDAAFDVVVCWEVLEHLPENTEQKAFDEVARVLRPGGVLYLSTPNNAPLPTLSDPAWWLIGHRHYRRAEVAHFAAAAGLTVEALETRGRLWSLVETLDLYISKWIFRRPAILADRLRSRMDSEWERPGFANVFLRARLLQEGAISEASEP